MMPGHKPGKPISSVKKDPSLGTSVDPRALRTAGEITLPYVADFYDDVSNRLGAIGRTAANGLIPNRESGAGNALGEAIIACHRFLYAVTEETGDSHRAVGRAVAEAADEYQQADEESAADFSLSEEEITDSAAGHFTDVDAGQYEYGEGRYTSVDAMRREDGRTGSYYEAALTDEKPVDYQDYEITHGEDTKGAEMTEWAEEVYEEIHGVKPGEEGGDR